MPPTSHPASDATAIDQSTTSSNAQSSLLNNRAGAKDAHANKHPHHNNQKNSPRGNKKWFKTINSTLLSLVTTLSALWLSAALWYQLRLTPLLCWLLIGLVVGLAMLLLLARHSLPFRRRLSDLLTSRMATPKRLALLYLLVWLIGLGWFVTLKPQDDRDWKPEVAHILDYQRDANNPNLVTLYNVRNFDWQDKDTATERWQTRQVDLSKLRGVNVVNAYWMGPMIAHTLVSFEFEDDRPLSFSFEIRKERHESFSAIGGFFKQYELSLIASEERDIIYTRTNARGEQVYLFPIDNVTQADVRALFESYLQAADELQAKPAWYNTLTSNCTNIIFYMARIISGDKLPWDYRIWASGYLPNYLYDMKILPNSANSVNSVRAAADSAASNDATLNSETNIVSEPTDEIDSTHGWDMRQWYLASHINPKTKDFSAEDNKSLDAYSKLIRQGLPETKLREE